MLVAAASLVLTACGYDGPDRSLPNSSAPAVAASPEMSIASTPVRTPESLPVAPRSIERRDAVDWPTPAAPAAVAEMPTIPSLAVTVDPAPQTNAPTTPSTIPPSTVPETTTASTTPPTATMIQEIAPRRVLVIGDSTAAAIRWSEGAADALRGADFTLDVESCRRLVEPSCNGVEGYAPSTALDALQWHAAGGFDTLVMATGYNDVGEDFVDAFDRIVIEARRQGISTILWTTYREQVGTQLPNGASRAYEEMNEAVALRVLSGQHPDLHLLDWWGFTRNASEWLTGDGVHLSSAGAYGMADLISRTLASIDGRPCPLPWEFAATPVDPCPPPLEQLGERGSVPQVKFMYDALR